MGFCTKKRITATVGIVCGILALCLAGGGFAVNKDEYDKQCCDLDTKQPLPDAPAACQGGIFFCSCGLIGTGDVESIIYSDNCCYQAPYKEAHPIIVIIMAVIFGCILGSVFLVECAEMCPECCQKCTACIVGTINVIAAVMVIILIALFAAAKSINTATGCDDPTAGSGTLYIVSLLFAAGGVIACIVMTAIECCCDEAKDNSGNY